MKYYSEETVRKIIKSVAHTALECSDNFADAIIRNRSCIEIPTQHGRLGDLDKLFDDLKHMCVLDSLTYTTAHEILQGLVKNAETVIEADMN